MLLQRKGTLCYTGTKDAEKISLTHSRWLVRVDKFTSLREIIHQSTTVVGVIDFGQSRPCICSPGLTNHQQVTLSNYEVWYYGLGDYDASAGPRACQLSELDFHFSCLFVCTIGWQPGCAHLSGLIRKKKKYLLVALCIVLQFPLSSSSTKKF